MTPSGAAGVRPDRSRPGGRRAGRSLPREGRHAGDVRLPIHAGPDRASWRRPRGSARERAPERAGRAVQRRASAGRCRWIQGGAQSVGGREARAGTRPAAARCATATRLPDPVAVRPGACPGSPHSPLQHALHATTRSVSTLAGVTVRTGVTCSGHVLRAIHRGSPGGRVPHASLSRMRPGNMLFPYDRLHAMRVRRPAAARRACQEAS